MVNTENKIEMAKALLSMSDKKSLNRELNDVLPKELSKVDLEIQDILHMLELKSFNASMGYKYAKQLQDARSRRRKIKQDIDLLIVLVKLLPNNSNELKQTIHNVERPRRYVPRVREDLTEEFEVLYQNEVSSVR